MTNNNNTTDKGNTMSFRKTYQETIVETNSEGIELCSPRYGHRWSINAPHKREGWKTTMHIGSQQEVQAMWDAYYGDKPVVIIKPEPMQWKHYD